MTNLDARDGSGTPTGTTSTSGLSVRWWAFVLRGLAAVAFGVLCWILPEIGLLSLVFMFGVWALAEGSLALAAAIRREGTERPWWILALQGVAGVVAGLFTFLSPGITAFALLMLIATWAIVAGGLQIVTAIRLRKEIEGEWLLALGGLVSVLFGGLLVIFPGPGALALIVWIGAFAVLFGALLVVLGLRMRNRQRRGAPDRRQPERMGGTYAAGH